jgi:hypothetical protein
MSDNHLPWPDPDMLLVQPHIRPPALPVHLFGSFEDWIRYAAHRKNAPEDYIALSLLVVAAGVVGNARAFVPWKDWEEPCILWGACVGRPSGQKSPAMDAVLNPLRAVEEQLVGEWEDSVAITSGDEEHHQGRPRLIVNDVTAEKAAAICSEHLRGFLQLRDELGGWIGSLDKYGGGRGERYFWIEAFGARSYSVERQKYDVPVFVPRLSISLIGAVQPDTLHDLFLRTREDGLVPRFIPVWPEPVPLRRPTQELNAPLDLELALRRLHSLKGLNDVDSKPVRMTFTDDAADLLQQYRVRIDSVAKDTDGLLESFIGKSHGLCVRVAGILTLLDWSVDGQVDPPTSIQANEVHRAAAYFETYAIPMARRVYGDAGTPKEDRAATIVARWVRDNGLHELTVRDITNKRWRGLRRADEIRRAFDVLIQAGWLRHSPEPTRGRPRDCYLVNPKLNERVLVRDG